MESDPAVPARILHITGRSDHGGGPEHLLQVLTASEARTSSFVACPRQGLYWNRYQSLIGSGNLCATPHRRITPLSLHSVIRFVRTNGIQIVHSHGMSGGIYGRLISLLTRIPCVHTFHGLPRTLTFKHVLYYHVERELSRYTKLGVAVSPGEFRLIARRYPMYQGRLTIVKNGIETSGAERNSRSDRLACPVRALRDIVSFTRLNEQKNPWLVLDIARELKARNELSDIRFCLYGEKVNDPAFCKQVRSAGLTEHVHLYPPTDNPAAVLSRAFAYLSTSRWEGMPLSLLEAHREGTCVIATKVIGNRDVIENGVNGMLYAEGDARSAADCIISIKHNPELRFTLLALGASGCREHHNRDIMAARLHLIYQVVSNQAPTQRRTRPLTTAAAKQRIFPVMRTEPEPIAPQQLRAPASTPAVLGLAGYASSEFDIAIG